MKIINLILFLLFFKLGYSNNDTSCRKEFLERIVSDTTRTSVYLSLKISDNNGTRGAIVHNRRFFEYLSKEFGYNYDNYRSQLLLSIERSTPLMLEGIVDKAVYIPIDSTTYPYRLYKRGGFGAIIKYYLRNGLFDYKKKDSFYTFEFFFNHNYYIKEGGEEGIGIHKFRCKEH